MGIFEELVLDDTSEERALDDTSEELTLVDLKTLRAGQGNQGRGAGSSTPLHTHRPRLAPS